MLAMAVAMASPAPAATPPKTIIHVHVSPLCTGLRQNIGPAIGKVLQNDKTIADSRPLLRGYVKAVATNSASRDLQVSRIERLVTPLVKNTAAIERSIRFSAQARLGVGPAAAGDSSLPAASRRAAKGRAGRDQRFREH